MKKVFLLVMVMIMVLGISVFADGIPSGTPVIAFDKLGGIVIGAFQAVAVIAAVAILLYVGIKFMLASPAEKANIKGMLIPYIIGAVLIFAAAPILGIFKDLGEQMEDADGDDDGALNNHYAVIIEK